MAATVLLVDDENNILLTLKQALVLEGYEVELASSGQVALEVVSAKPVDAVVMDVKMPDMDGITALERMSKDHPRLPVIMMSGHGTIDTAVRALIANQASRAEAIVREHAVALDAIARALVDRGVLMASEVLAIAADQGVPLQHSIERAELVDEHWWIVTYVVRRYQGKGEPSEDLQQVAALGLVAAIERYDPEAGSTFPAFAIPTEPETSLRKTAVNMAIFVAAGVILAIVAVIGGMLLDRSFRLPIDVQHGLGLPVLALVPEAGPNAVLPRPARRDQTGAEPDELIGRLRHALDDLDKPEVGTLPA